MRLFLITLVIHFALLSSLINTSSIQRISDNDMKKVAKSELLDEYSTLINNSDVLNLDCPTDTLTKRLFNTTKPSDQDTFKINMKLISVDMSDLPMLRKDVYEMPIDTLMSKYQITDFFEKLVVSQYIRAFRDLSGASRFFVGNMIWGVITTIFILGLLMKILYFRRNKYYVEHTVVLFNIHSFSFITASLAIGIHYIDDSSTVISMALMIAFAINIIYFYWTLKSYYSQGWFKTLIKFLIISLGYIFTLSMGLILVLLISLFFFS